jgi:hypothetical protein
MIAAMNSPKALLLILALAGQPAIFPQDAPSPEPPEIRQIITNGNRVFRSGKLRFTYSSSGISLELGTEKRHIELNQLPVYTNDCTDGPSQCSSKGRTFCGTCIKQFNAVAWDERRQRVFFAIATDTSQNKPWILAGYDFRSNRITRFGEFWGGGAGGVAISPSGRYLAMQGYGVCGICCTSTYLMVADLADRRIGTGKRQSSSAPGEDRDVITIENIRWSSEREILYDDLTHKEKDCREDRNYEKRPGRINLADIAFP